MDLILLLIYVFLNTVLLLDNDDYFTNAFKVAINAAQLAFVSLYQFRKNCRPGFMCYLHS